MAQPNMPEKNNPKRKAGSAKRAICKPYMPALSMAIALSLRVFSSNFPVAAFKMSCA